MSQFLQDLIGLGLILFGLWVLSVELRLQASKLLGEALVEDLYQRGKISKETRDSVVCP